jgi:hypothetical protein
MERLLFYAPQKDIDWLFEKDEINWEDICKVRRHCSGNFTSWIATTYLNLNKRGVPCSVVKTMPQKGIVLADRDTLGDKTPYLQDVMLVCPKGDREFHPSAEIHIVHNQMEYKNSRNIIWNPYFIPHWPQPGIIARDPQRSNRIENIGFFGTGHNLTEEFKSSDWAQALNKLGCQWKWKRKPMEWNDYSEIDLIVAARSFDRFNYSHKPASKLINCWQAGVPGLLAPESAFITLKKSSLDFIEVRSLQDVIYAISDLRRDPQRYRAMVENGYQRAQKFSTEAVAQAWEVCIENYLYPAYEEFQRKSRTARKLAYLNRILSLKRSRFSSNFSRSKYK